MTTYTGLSTYKNRGVSTQDIFAKLFKATTPTKTINPFGTNNNRYIESGQSTKDIQTALEYNRQTSGTEFIRNLNTNFSQITDAILGITKALPQGAPTQGSSLPNPPSSSAPGQNSQIQTSGNSLTDGWKQIKDYIGPAGLLVGALALGILVLKR